ncbi:hypothetical protein Q7C36_012228 [Tachysurus vachellii]|uniref:Uncharacterized protein n=1 Tax=Tachysurus vachellii TaxID=175792 RepID=A0AA88ML29_TACVA|nr:hypothetical protein Q7C36_012228 [Tachysurus vachellii]
MGISSVPMDAGIVLNDDCYRRGLIPSSQPLNAKSIQLRFCRSCDSSVCRNTPSGLPSTDKAKGFGSSTESFSDPNESHMS